MRDRRFVAEHRGGPLTKPQHHTLIRWAYACVKHAMKACGVNPDKRLTSALDVAGAWVKGRASVGEARQAATSAIAAARAAKSPVAIALARAAGQAVAVAHMADHALVAAWYALRAVKAAGLSADAERKWQDDRLPAEIRNLVLSAGRRTDYMYRTNRTNGTNGKEENR